jgi:O-antigen ligase
MRANAAPDLSAVGGELQLSSGEPLLFYLIALWLVLVQISIAASQIVLGAVLLLWFYRLREGKLRWVRLPIDLPVALFALTSLASAAFSFEPSVSFSNARKLALLVVPYVLVSALGDRPGFDRLVLLLIAIADLGALTGLWQYFFSDLGDINHRIRGFMSHYMTFSGLLMGVGVLATARLVFGGGPRWFLLSSLVLLGSALALTLTRSAWLGCLAAAALLLFLRDRRLLVLLPALALLAAILVPPEVRERVQSFFNPDLSGRDRYYMLSSGLHMTARHPWFGVGLDMVKEVYPIYKMEAAPHTNNVHLHNNFSQIAAERGLPCLAAWIWLMGLTLIWSIRVFRAAPPGSSDRALGAGSLGFLVAAIVAGVFEYNFGDSEFLMLVLFVVAIPFAMARMPGGLDRSELTASKTLG